MEWYGSLETAPRFSICCVNGCVAAKNRFWPSGLQGLVNLQIHTNVSNEHTTSIFRAYSRTGLIGVNDRLDSFCLGTELRVGGSLFKFSPTFENCERTLFFPTKNLVIKESSFIVAACLCL